MGWWVVSWLWRFPRAVLRRRYQYMALSLLCFTTYIVLVKHATTIEIALQQYEHKLITTPRPTDNQQLVSNDTRVNHRLDKLWYDKLNQPVLFKKWLGDSKSQCEGRFVGYGGRVALLQDAVVDGASAQGQRGGEDFKQLWNQEEQKEFFKFKPGFLKMQCEVVPKYKFIGRTHNTQWLNSLVKTSNMSGFQSTSQVYIAITRYEYVNIYHTMTDWYNAFLVMNFFNLTQRQTNILIVDGHPWGGLDPVWSTLFNSSLRVGHLTEPTVFRTLIMGLWGYDSPLFKGPEHLEKSSKEVTLIEEFREFFLDTYDLPAAKPLNCKNLTVTFIWRRPYYNHPRNPAGDVHRKIKNEQELINGVRKAYPHFIIDGIQTDNFTMREQLEYFSGSDIIVGMHGAALTLCLMMPKHGALLELMPNYINPGFKKHFINIAGWRHLMYRRWVNDNKSLEYPDHYTKVPPDIVIEHIKDIHSHMCPSKKPT